MAASSTSVAPRWASATSPTTSSDPSSTPADSDPCYTVKCDEPGKFAWLYNDDYVDTEDDYQHSKWLAFMDRRLRLARELLKPSGAIMVSIGDDEQHRLRMLMEQIFGVTNHVAQLAIEMSTTSGPKTTNAQQGTIVKN